MRKQLNQRGDFALIGNTAGYDCAGSAGMPVVGTVGACGVNVADSAVDIYWRSDDPMAGQVHADLGVAPAQARTTTMLTQNDLPMGATISYARLYWGSMLANGAPAMNVVLERPNVFMSNVTADGSVTQMVNGRVWYQNTADVTTAVTQNGIGAYRVSGIPSMDFRNLNDNSPYIGWTIVVFYALQSDPPRNLTLFDGLDVINGANVMTTITGFLVPMSGYKARLGVVAYEGDVTIPGDSLIFNGATLSDALNPANNFFNSTHSALGTAVSVMGDLPQLTGNPGSMSGIDIDTIDVTPQLKAGDMSATITASTQGDVYAVGVWVTSISTLAPNFSTSKKTVANITRQDGTIKVGDTLEYTIVAENTGDDTAIDVVLEDVVPNGVTYLPSSLLISAGPNMGMKTDLAMDDQAEYEMMTKTARFRLGTGATATQGGQIPVGQSSTVKFRVTVDPNANGTIKNQAKITAKGLLGAPASDYPSSSENGPGSTTDVTVDECTKNSDCPIPKGICDSGKPRICRPCTPANNEADCSPEGKICATSGPLQGSCVQCTTDAQCKNGVKCDIPSGLCGGPDGGGGGGNGIPASLEGGGCACTQGGSTASLWPLGLFAALAGVLLRRRRR
jgi:uncharacterized repeat protein (TIGR01451 family)/MYXO-CTERM domain-containing protein